MMSEADRANDRLAAAKQQQHLVRTGPLPPAACMGRRASCVSFPHGIGVVARSCVCHVPIGGTTVTRERSARKWPPEISMAWHAGALRRGPRSVLNGALKRQVSAISRLLGHLHRATDSHCTAVAAACRAGTHTHGGDPMSSLFDQEPKAQIRSA